MHAVHINQHTQATEFGLLSPVAEGREVSSARKNAGDGGTKLSSTSLLTTPIDWYESGRFPPLLNRVEGWTKVSSVSAILTGSYVCGCCDASLERYPPVEMGFNGIGLALPRFLREALPPPPRLRQR